MKIKQYESVLFLIANKHAAIKPNLKQLQEGNSNICIKKRTLRITKNKCSSTILQWFWTLTEDK